MYLPSAGRIPKGRVRLWGRAVELARSRRRPGRILDEHIHYEKESCSMKKFLAMLLAVVMTMGLVACGGNNSGKDNDSQGGGAVATASFFCNM